MYFSNQTPRARDTREYRAMRDQAEAPARPRPAITRPQLRPQFPGARPADQGQALALAVCLAALVIGITFFSLAIHYAGVLGQ